MNLQRQILTIAAGFMMTVSGIGAAVMGLMGNLLFASILGMIMVSLWLGVMTYLNDPSPSVSPKAETARYGSTVTQTDAQPHPFEVGLIAYWSETIAYIFSTQAIPITAHSIQPYVELQVGQANIYQIRFEILDANHQHVFSQIVEPFLVQATNLILSPTRLPLRDLPLNGRWTLRVSVDGASHITQRILWRSDRIERVEGHIDSDGEIDQSILPLLADNYAQPLSLDALLTGNSE